LPTANLANEKGSGFSYGFFDSADNFIEVGNTWREKITIAKDKTLFLADGVYCDTKPSTYQSQIGAYHIQLPNRYSSFSEALSVASSYDESGGVPFAFPAYVNGSYCVRLDHFSSAQNASAALSSYPVGSSVVGESTSCYSVIATGSGKIVFEFDAGQSTFLAVKPITMPGEKASTWFKGYQYPGAFEYKRLYGNDITVINAVYADDYVAGVVPYEMSASWPIEALKAQAICARTYAISNLRKHSASGFDICNSTDCQVYYGVYTGEYASRVEEACSATAGLCVYYNGEIASTFYCSSDGGSTESAKNVWGKEVPYLQAVPDPYEELTYANKGIWSVTYTCSELTWLLQNKGYTCSDIVDCYVKTRTPAGNVYEVVMVDKNGREFSFTGEKARSIFYSATLGKSANSIRYEITSDGAGARTTEIYIQDSAGSQKGESKFYVIGSGGAVSAYEGGSVNVITSSGTHSITGAGGSSSGTGTKATYFTLNGTGWGHNVGMSQRGAKGMAERGFSYSEIIGYYFTGVYIA